MIKKIIIGVGVAYVLDVTVREAMAYSRARKKANELGKPMLNVGSGYGFSSFTGAKMRGDVNCDLAAPRANPCGSMTVCFCDIEDLSRFGDKQFGVALAANVMKYVPNVEKAMLELHRVADIVIVSSNVLPWPQIGAGSTMALNGVNQ